MQVTSKSLLVASYDTTCVALTLPPMTTGATSKGMQWPYSYLNVVIIKIENMAFCLYVGD